MARERCLVIDLSSHRSAQLLAIALREDGAADVDVEGGRIWWFLASVHSEEDARARLERLLVRASLTQALASLPSYREWREARHRYVDPSQPEVDPDHAEVWIDSLLAPGEIEWQVRLILDSALVFGKVKRQLPPLARPVIGEGNRHIDLGARDAEDAEQIVRKARSLEGVTNAGASEIHGRFRRWRLRQRIAGNFATFADGGFSYYHGGDWGGGGGGDGGGGGHGGH